MEILNLYACLGGNRELWGDDHQVTAVEIDPYLAEIYKRRFPNDTVIVGDAHQYLLDHYFRFGFVWSSPPCPTHSRARFWNTKAKRVYPDMSLYQEIIFLDTHFEGLYCVENVKPYYTPLIPAHEIGRHLFWTNFKLGSIKVKNDQVLKASVKNNELVEMYKGDQRKDKIIRNMVNPIIGKYILDRAQGIIEQQNKQQLTIF